MQAMESLYRKYYDTNSPYVSDIAAFYADAIINTTPWNYYENDSITPVHMINEAIIALKNSMDKSHNNNLLALHLYIHVTEQSHNPWEGKHISYLTSLRVDL